MTHSDFVKHLVITIPTVILMPTDSVMLTHLPTDSQKSTDLRLHSVIAMPTDSDLLTATPLHLDSVTDLSTPMVIEKRLEMPTVMRLPMLTVTAMPKDWQKSTVIHLHSVKPKPMDWLICSAIVKRLGFAMHSAMPIYLGFHLRSAIVMPKDLRLLTDFRLHLDSDLLTDSPKLKAISKRSDSVTLTVMVILTVTVMRSVLLMVTMMVNPPLYK